MISINFLIMLAATIAAVFAAETCVSSVFDNSGEIVCVDPCTYENVSWTIDGNPVCLTVDATDEVCPRDSIAFDDEGNPECITDNEGLPCKSENIFSSKAGPVCLPVGTPECLSVAFFDEEPECQACIVENVFYDSNKKPKCHPVGEPGCITVRYFKGDPMCYDCDARHLFFDGDNMPICLPLDDPDCLSVAFVDKTPTCFACMNEELMYTKGVPSC